MNRVDASMRYNPLSETIDFKDISAKLKKILVDCDLKCKKITIEYGIINVYFDRNTSINSILLDKLFPWIEIDKFEKMDEKFTIIWRYYEDGDLIEWSDTYILNSKLL